MFSSHPVRKYPFVDSICGEHLLAISLDVMTICTRSFQLIFEAAFSGYEALKLSTDSIINCKWMRLRIPIARNSKGHILSLPPSSNSCHSSSAYYIWEPFNTSSRGTQSFTTKLLSESLPPSSLLEILFNTPCCIPLAKYCLDQKACCFPRPLLCPSQVFLGQDRRLNNPFELVFQFPMCTFQWQSVGLLYSDLSSQTQNWLNICFALFSITCTAFYCSSIS